MSAGGGFSSRASSLTSTDEVQSARSVLPNSSPRRGGLPRNVSGTGGSPASAGASSTMAGEVPLTGLNKRSERSIRGHAGLSRITSCMASDKSSSKRCSARYLYTKLSRCFSCWSLSSTSSTSALERLMERRIDSPGRAGSPKGTVTCSVSLPGLWKCTVALPRSRRTSTRQYDSWQAAVGKQ